MASTHGVLMLTEIKFASMQKGSKFELFSSCCDLVILVDFGTYSLLINALTNTATKTSRGNTHGCFSGVFLLTIVFSATNTLVMVLAKAIVIARKCTTTTTASPIM